MEKREGEKCQQEENTGSKENTRRPRKRESKFRDIEEREANERENLER